MSRLLPSLRSGAEKTIPECATNRRNVMQHAMLAEQTRAPKSSRSGLTEDAYLRALLVVTC